MTGTAYKGTQVRQPPFHNRRAGFISNNASTVAARIASAGVIPNSTMRENCEDRALAIMRRQITTIGDNWDVVCDEASLGIADRRLLWRRQFLNDLAFEGLEGRLAVPGQPLTTNLT